MIESSKSSDATTSVIVLNYNNGADTLNCLITVETALRNDSRLSLVVVDNNSSDHSRVLLREWCAGAVGRSLSVNFVQSERNDGYGAGNNQGISAAKKLFAPEWYWILNNDASLEKDTASAILTHLMVSRAQMVGMRIHTIGQDSNQDILGGGKLRRWQGRTVMSRPASRFEELDFLSGSSFLLRSNLVEQVGGFAEDHFLFWEEMELAERSRNFNALIEVVPEAVVNHVGGAKSGASIDGKSETSFYYSTRAAIFYYRKHENRFALSWLVVVRLSLALQCLLARRPGAAGAVFRGIADGLRKSLRDLQ